MSKFKIGDEVKFSKRLYIAVDFDIGDTFRVTAVKCNGNNIEITPIDSKHRPFGTYTVDQFELVQNEPEYLTPEQVLQYFKEGRQGELECSSKVKASGWAELLPNEDMYISQINERKWRIKPVPKTINYYGTELPKPIDISKLDGSTVVYVPQIHRGTVNPITVERAKKYHFYKDALHFSTYEDAILVLDTVLKPFKQ